MYAKIAAWVMSFLPDSAKSILIKAAFIIAGLAISFGAGFYTGWHLSNERFVVKQLEELQQSTQNKVQVSIEQSDETANKIEKESQLANELKQQHKDAFYQDQSGVLGLRLPDDVIGLLNNASSPRAVSSSSGVNDPHGKSQTIHGANGQ